MNLMPLDVARAAFAALVTGPEPLAVDGGRFAGLPDRAVPLDEVRDRLLSARCSRSVRDAVWAHLVVRSREDGPSWTVGAVGVALPALTSVAARLSARFAGDPADIHAEVLTGYMAALAQVDLDRPRIVLRLRWAAYRAGHRAVREALDAPTPAASGFGSQVPARPWGHPDLVLADAVADGVVTQLEADLIGATRLEQVPVAVWADEHDVSEWAAYKARRRAEHRLLAALRDAPPDPADDPVPYLAGAGVKPAAPLSKTGAESGVQVCRAIAPSGSSQEEPRCA